jgi:hypothetical protein
MTSIKKALWAKNLVFRAKFWDYRLKSPPLQTHPKNHLKTTKISTPRPIVHRKKNPSKQMYQFLKSRVLLFPKKTRTFLFFICFLFKSLFFRILLSTIFYVCNIFMLHEYVSIHFVKRKEIAYLEEFLLNLYFS